MIRALSTSDARHAIAHNKVMVIDGKVIITGSFILLRRLKKVMRKTS